MAYITRELERKFLKLNAFFKVILVTGARPVSYTHLLFIRSTFLCCYYTPSERGLQLGIMPIYDGTCVLPCVPIIHPCPASGQKWL